MLRLDFLPLGQDGGVTMPLYFLLFFLRTAGNLLPQCPYFRVLSDVILYVCFPNCIPFLKSPPTYIQFKVLSIRTSGFWATVLCTGPLVWHFPRPSTKIPSGLRLPKGVYGSCKLLWESLLYSTWSPNSGAAGMLQPTPTGHLQNYLNSGKKELFNSSNFSRCFYGWRKEWLWKNITA